MTPRLLAIAAVLAGACAPADERAEPAPRRAPAPVARPVADPRASTIARGDYVGPSACGECHPDEHARWLTSLHRRMNQRAGDPGAILGDFATTRRYRDGTVRFARDGAAFTMTFARDGAAPVRYRVTRTIGVRALQEYVGVREGDPRGEEVRLPFGWWPRHGGWAAQPEFDPWLAERDFDPYAPVVEPWATRCPWCHSTYPFAQRIARATARPVGHGLEQYFTTVASAEPERLAVAEQVTIGISCESCHLGGRAHAAGAPIHLVPAGATPRPGAPIATEFRAEARDAAIVNATCAQCHSGPSPRLPDGAALRNSSEALDLAASACRGARCLDCHDPHTGATDDARAIAACTRCHGALAQADVAAAHAGPHAPAQASCLDCHMPRFVLGVDRFVRSHRISAPTDRRVLAAAGPNACNLCHLDQPIAWTVAELARHWERRFAPALDTAAYAKADSVGATWLAAREPALQLIAIAAYARAGQHVAAPAGAPAYVRAWATFLAR